MDYTKLTLGELLTHTNETIKRNAMSILKTLQKKYEYKCPDRHLMHITDEFKTQIFYECFNCNITKLVNK